jgi:S-adenosylmethionine:tRNA ribosyltransferase-isomerase
LQTSDFDIQVPREQVAQTPVEPRDSSKLLAIDRSTGVLRHLKFWQLPNLLRWGDCLVFNNSRVIPARLRGTIHEEPMREVVVVLLRKLEVPIWEALIEVGEVEAGQILDFRSFTSRVISVGEKIGKRLERLITLTVSDETKLDSAGELPIPPYIKGYTGEGEKYQTVYSKIRGSAAAPTAGLHFTDRLLDELIDKGVNLYFVTLHVGIDTFMPIQEATPQDHKMYTEFCQMSDEVAFELNVAKKDGRRVIGVGTTSVRTMESAHNGTEFKAYSDWTSIYILPGYKFKSIDCMITNFHYPRSTNLLMISAFAGYENTKRAYKEAVDKGYRFYSFGDSTIIL